MTKESPIKKKLSFKEYSTRKVIYGITDRRNDPTLVKINDFLIDHSRISLKEKKLFFHSLQLLVNSGMRFIRSLQMLAERTQNLRLKRILDTIAYDMNSQGMHFSDAIAKYPTVFSEYEIKMIHSGELTGKIRDSLQSIAEQLRKNIKLESQIRSAMLYPATVLGAIVLAATIVLIYIIPKFTILFSEFAIELPFFTRLLIGISNFFVNFWWVIIISVWAIWQVFKNWKNSEEGKREWDKILLNLPIIGSLIRNIQTIRIANNFSTLMKAGIPVHKTLRILNEIMPNSVIKDALFTIELNVENGMRIYESFTKEKDLDPILGEVIEIGEKSGNISDVLDKVGEQYELEVESQLKNMTTLLEPIVILIVGVAVVFMAMAVLTPIFELQKAFGTI